MTKNIEGWRTGRTAHLISAIETIIDHPVEKVWPALDIGSWMSAHRLEAIYFENLRRLVDGEARPQRDSSP